MPIVELFSTRKRDREKSGQPDVYTYDKIPEALRVQVQQILVDAIGRYHEHTGYGVREVSGNNEAWQLHKTICRERGVHRLSNGDTPFHQLMDLIGNPTDMDAFLDVVELCARYLDRVAAKYSDYDRETRSIKQEAAAALDELNYRFRKAGFGFQYEDGILVRMDSQYVHAKIVKPALTLLARRGFSGPEAEFRQAHTHLRNGNPNDAVTWAGKAFESTMKAICDQKKWTYDPGARASDLLKILRAKKLWPEHLDASFDQLLATLASGLPQVRNKGGSHGDGAQIKDTPQFVASYAMHLCAAKIVFLIEAASFK